MPTSQELLALLENNYDKRKKARRKLFGDHPAIAATRKYLLELQRLFGANHSLTDPQIFQVVRFFAADHPTLKGSASRDTWYAIIEKIFPRRAAALFVPFLPWRRLDGSLVEYDSLVEFSQIAQFLEGLNQAGLLTQHVFEDAKRAFGTSVLREAGRLVQNKLKTTVEVFETLQRRTNILAEKRDAIKNHNRPIDAILAISGLHKNNMVQDNIDVVMRHGKPLDAAAILLRAAWGLNPSIRNIIANHHLDPETVDRVLNLLVKIGLSDPENLNTLFTKAYMLLIDRANFWHKDDSLFTPDTWRHILILCSSPDPLSQVDHYLSAAQDLHVAGLFNPTNLKALFTNNRLLLTAAARTVFWNKIDRSLLTSDTWQHILDMCTLPDPLPRARRYLNAASYLQEAGLFNLDNLNVLVANDGVLLTEAAQATIWGRMPTLSERILFPGGTWFTPNAWQHIVELSSLPNPWPQIERYVNAVYLLYQSGLFNLDNLNALHANSHILLTANAKVVFWDKIKINSCNGRPSSYFSNLSDHWQHILELCAFPDPLFEIQRYMLQTANLSTSLRPRVQQTSSLLSADQLRTTGIFSRGDDSRSSEEGAKVITTPTKNVL